MNYRTLGSTGMRISEIGFGGWAIGGGWGRVVESDAMGALRAALERGVNFFDTADVYGDGRSERLIAQLRKETGIPFYVATKAGRGLNPHTAEAYTSTALRSFVQGSLKNLGTDSLDLLQLHCPPTQVYYRPEIFAALEGMKKEGLLKHYGVSVEKVEEAIKALEFEGVETVQIIFNLFRLRPAELFFPMALNRKVGIIVRVPLASGLLTGKFRADSAFDPEDHRTFNRRGEAFDVGETFSGVPFDVALAAVEELRSLVPAEATLTQFALKWILMQEAVSCVIPGGKIAEQVYANCAASDLQPLDPGTMEAARSIYERLVKSHVHQRW